MEQLVHQVRDPRLNLNVQSARRISVKSAKSYSTKTRGSFSMRDMHLNQSHPKRSVARLDVRTRITLMFTVGTAICASVSPATR